MNGPVWKGESDRFSEAQLEMHRAAMRWQTDQQLREAYELYRGKLALDAEGWPPNAARVQLLRDSLARAAASKGSTPACSA